MLYDWQCKKECCWTKLWQAGNINVLSLEGPSIPPFKLLFLPLHPKPLGSCWRFCCCRTRMVREREKDGKHAGPAQRAGLQATLRTLRQSCDCESVGFMQPSYSNRRIRSKRDFGPFYAKRVFEYDLTLAVPSWGPTRRASCVR